MQPVTIKVIKPSVEIMTDLMRIRQMPKLLEIAGRTCYKSEGKISAESADTFIKKIIKLGHESVLEHESFTVRFTGSRSFSHQLVRHRLGAYSQESQRYCNYGKSEALQVILPEFGDIGLIGAEITTDFLEHSQMYTINKANRLWLKSCFASYRSYLYLLDQGIRPEEAREVLPNATKTEVVTTYNLRQWRHFFKVRGSSHAQAQIRHLALDLREQVLDLCPSIFEDLTTL